MFKNLKSSTAGTAVANDAALDALLFDREGLIPAVARQCNSCEVLMLPRIIRATLKETLTTGRACYPSRSRNALWRKGVTSGCSQAVMEVHLDCDGDAVLVLVDQHGGRGYTGHCRCPYDRIDNDGFVVLSDPPPRQGESQ